MYAGKTPLVRRRTIMVSLALAFVAGGCGRRRRGGVSYGGGANGDEGSGDNAPSPPRAGASAHAKPGAIAKAVQKSVLSVRAGSGRGTGSGFVIDDDGHILTNAHVIEGASALELVLPDGRTVDATIVGSRVAANIALLRTSASGIPPAALGRSSDLRVGDSVVAVGPPAGPASKVTTGIVSALKRRVALSRSGPRQEVIQTDAAIDTGNTGGPLVNGDGRVVGVNTTIADLTGIGFAIPIERALDIAHELTD